MDKSVAWRLLKEPRTRLVIAGFAGLAPIVVGGLIWISRLSSLKQMMVGTFMGIASVASLHYMGEHRSHQRSQLAVIVQQFSQMQPEALRRLLSTSYFPVWIQSASAFEKVSWLNKELDEVWPFVDKAASEMLKLQLQPILDQYKYGPILELSIKSITLGTLSPVIGGVQFTAGGKDESTLEIEVDWRHSDQKMVLEIKTIGPDLTVQVKDLMIYGVLRLWFKPLVEQLPCFGAVVASLREPPLVDFRTKFLGGDATKIPGLDSMIDDIIRTSLLDMLVWPSRMIFPIIPGDYSFLELHPVGILVVTLIEAKHLLNKELFSKSDPFAYLYIRQRQDHMKKSSGKSNTHHPATHHPTWNETFELQVEDVDSQKLTVRLMDEDNLNPADFLGIAVIPLKEFEPNVSRDMWVNLAKDPQKPESDKQRGEVHIRATYKPFGQQRNEEGLALDGEQESMQGQQRNEEEFALDGEKESMLSTSDYEKPAIQEKNYQNQVEPSLKGQVDGGESETISMDPGHEIKGQETKVGPAEEPVKSENGMVPPEVPIQAEPINA